MATLLLLLKNHTHVFYNNIGINYSYIISLLSLKRKVRFMRSPVCLSVCPSVCVSPPNNFWTNWYIFVKFSRKVMSLKVTSKPYFLIPYLQPLQNGGRSNFWGGCRTCTSQRGTMKFCILTNLQRMNNFQWDHFSQKQNIRTWRPFEC
jgi:hypothetical protein